ncbi:MAG: hypothetical protein ACOVKC_10235 [Brevundimonas sp.]
MSLKKLLKGKKTYLGIALAVAGPNLIPTLVQYAPALLDAVGVAPGTAGKIVGIAGALLAIYGRAKATAPARPAV